MAVCSVVVHESFLQLGPAWVMCHAVIGCYDVDGRVPLAVREMAWPGSLALDAFARVRSLVPRSQTEGEKERQRERESARALGGAGRRRRGDEAAA